VGLGRLLEELLLVVEGQIVAGGGEQGWFEEK